MHTLCFRIDMCITCIHALQCVGSAMYIMLSVNHSWLIQYNKWFGNLIEVQYLYNWLDRSGRIKHCYCRVQVMNKFLHKP
jgi:hypothetical protein